MDWRMAQHTNQCGWVLGCRTNGHVHFENLLARDSTHNLQDAKALASFLTKKNSLENWHSTGNVSAFSSRSSYGYMWSERRKGRKDTTDP